jgi:hypothetical protein
MSKKNGLKHSETAQHRYENVKIIRNFDKKLPFRFKIFYENYFKCNKCIIYACDSITCEIMQDNSAKTPLKVVL